MYRSFKVTAHDGRKLLALLCLSTLLTGFETLYSDKTRWRSTPSYSVRGYVRGVSEQGALDSVRSSFNSWSSVQGGGLSFNEVSSGASIPVEFVQDWPQEFGENTLGITLPYTSGGRFTSAEIVINDQNFSWTTTPNPSAPLNHLDSTLIHEIGHAIGLSHSYFLEATMYWASSARDQHILHEDDIRGFRYLYGGVSAGRMCDTCLSDDECLSGLCFDFGNVTACGASCGPAPSYLCSDAPADRAACFEFENGALSCLPLALDCSESSVGVVEEGGYCFGAQHCESGLTCVVTPEDARCRRPGSLQVGEECVSSELCQSQVCMPLSDTYAICVTECDPQNPRCEGECLEVRSPELDGVCIPDGDVPSGGECNGASRRCQSGLECNDGRCLGYCDPYGDCPNNLACTPVAGRWRCEPLTGPQEGEPCEDNRCGGGLFCLQSQQRCVVPCDPNDVTSCGGHACVELSAIGICSPGGLGGGAPCQEDIECSDFSCVELPSGGSACASLCELGCPDGWECSASPVGERPYCVPSPSGETPVEPGAGVEAPASGVEDPSPSAGQAMSPDPVTQPQPAGETGSLSGQTSPQATEGVSCQASSGASNDPLPLLVFCLFATYGVHRRRSRAHQPQGGSR